MFPKWQKVSVLKAVKKSLGSILEGKAHLGPNPALGHVPGPRGDGSTQHQPHVCVTQHRLPTRWCHRATRCGKVYVASTKT